jgi:RNA polymerase sigma factor (sigma-70 family)
MPSQSHNADQLPAQSDQLLVRDLRVGCQRAGQTLVDRYGSRLRALAEAKLSLDVKRQVDADDIVQSVFRRFLTAAGRGNYDVPDGDDLWDLLAAITVNRIRTELAYQRAAKRDNRRTSGAPEVDELPGPGSLDRADLEAGVRDVLSRLPETHRRVVDFRLEGYEVAEIARLLGRSKRTIERVLQEVRGLLGNLTADD